MSSVIQIGKFHKAIIQAIYYRTVKLIGYVIWQKPQ